MKKITTQQIEAVLQTIYQTNISAQMFDGIKKFFIDLPNVEEVKVEPINNTTEVKDGQ